MSNIKSIKPVLEKIKENRSSTLLPRNWVKTMAKSTGKSETIIREWADGIKNIPEGPLMVLEFQNRLMEKQREKIKKLTA